MAIHPRPAPPARPAGPLDSPGWIPLPLGLVADLAGLPFDVHVRVGAHAVLYARRDADPVGLIARADAAAIPELVIRAEDGAALRSILLETLVAAGGAGRQDPAERARRVAGAAATLLEPVLIEDARPRPDELVAAADAARLAARAIDADPRIAGRILHRRPASAAARRVAASRGRVHLERALDAIALGSVLARATAIDPPHVAEAAALRDLGLATRHDPRRHAVVAADRLLAAGRSGPVVAAVAAHHERLDGSGTPRGIAGTELGPPERIVALVDVLVAMTRRDAGGGLPIGEAFRALRMVLAGRFDGRIVLALATLIADGTLGPGRLDGDPGDQSRFA